MQGEFVRMQFEIHSTLSGREDHGSVSLENEVDKLQLSGTMFLQFQAHVCYSAKAVQRTRYSPRFLFFHFLTHRPTKPCGKYQYPQIAMPSMAAEMTQDAEITKNLIWNLLTK